MPSFLLNFCHLSFIEPNVGIVNVPDKRLDVLGEIHNSVKVVPAAVIIFKRDCFRIFVLHAYGLYRL